MLENNIYLTEEGYKQYCEEIEKIETEILKNTDYKVQAISEAPGDGWHDNFAYEDACRNENMLQKRLEQLLKQKGKIELIDSKVSDQSLVNIGDVIKLEFMYDDGDSEVEEIRLTGGEPLTHPNIYEICRIISEDYHLRVSINTCLLYTSDAADD